MVWLDSSYSGIGLYHWRNIMFVYRVIMGECSDSISGLPIYAENPAWVTGACARVFDWLDCMIPNNFFLLNWFCCQHRIIV